jgi:hypothetical protein
MNGFGIPVLGILQQDHHQKGGDGGKGVNYQLPGIGEIKSRTGQQPKEY